MTTMKNTNSKKVFNRTINVFAWILFILALFLAMTTIFASFSDDKNGKEIFGVKMLIVKSDSMSRPENNQNETVFFNAGDLILIKEPQDKYSLSAGEIITFISTNPDSVGQTVTHKIREAKYTQNGELIGYVTYGVFTGVNDTAIVQPDNVLGIYAGKIPLIGHVFAFLKTPQGYFLSILIPIIFLIIYFSIKVGKYFGNRESSATSDLNQEIEGLKKRIEALEANQASNPVTVSPIPVDASTLFVNEDTTPLSIPRGKKTSFATKLLGLDISVQEYFDAIHNQLVSYKKISDRPSFKCMSYRLGRRLLAKMTVRGKTLKLHLALDVNKFKESVYFQKDLSSVKAYLDVPFTVKVKSLRGKQNAIKLVDALMSENGVIKNERYIKVNAIELLKNERNEVVDTANATVSPDLSRRKKVSFAEKLFRLDKDKQEYFSTIHNQLVSYKKISDRPSFKCMSYRLGRRLLAKMTVRGKTLKLHLALDVNKFKESVYFQKDLSSVKAYLDVPFTVKIKSSRGEQNAIKLVDELMNENGVIKKERFVSVNVIDLLKNE